MERAVNWISRQTVQFESNCTISCREKEREREKKIIQPRRQSVSHFGFWQRFMLSPTRTHITNTHSLPSRSHVQWHTRLRRFLICLPACLRFFKCPLGRANLRLLPVSLSLFSISLFALPFVRSLAAVFNCFCLLFIYCLSMSLSICIVYFRWRHKPRRSGRQFDCLSRSTLLSLSLFISLSLSLPWLLCFLHAKCSANSGGRAINSERQRQTERQAHKQGTRQQRTCCMLHTQGG